MRQGRMRIENQDVWHHCYNRVAGTREDRPFGRVEKEQFVRILHRVSRLYTVRVVGYQVMSNHFHLLVHAPAKEPSAEEVCRRFSAFHGGKRSLNPDSNACRTWQARCRDVSWFMRHLQQLFTLWFNRTRTVRRRGKLWADRFKNTILESGMPVWRCWAYIENNPVRAGMVSRAADHRFGSLGVWHQRGRHPFADHVEQLLLPELAPILDLVTIIDLRDRLDQVLAEKVGQEMIKASAFHTTRQRVRYWTDGLIIGTEAFVRAAMASRTDNAAHHRVAQLTPASVPTAFVAWRRVRTSS